MKKLLSVLLVLVMVFSLAACGSGDNGGEAEGEVYNVGMICIGDENAAYDRNFYMAADAAKEQLAAKGINIEWTYTYNHPEGDPVATDCRDLGDAGCIAVFCNSYGMEPAMLTVAPEYPDTVFVGMTNENSWKDDLDNTVNAFPSVYEGRYLAGIAAGLKLNEMIAAGQFKPEEAKIGYVGAFTYAEVISGYTSFFLGARSVCPTATMEVTFTGSWYDETAEKEAANKLIGNGCKLISQHADSMGAPTACETAGVPNVSYNGSTEAACPNTFIVSSRINWAPYYEYAITAVVNGETIDADWTGTLATGSVVLTDINTAVAAEGTAEAIADATAKLESGEVQVFDCSAFTVSGDNVTDAMTVDADGHVTSYLADVDTDAAYTGDTEAVENGAFKESTFRAAPYFDLKIDGITLLDTAF
mgnify:CR=1 FL=1